MTKLKYTPEIRERAVQLLIESEKDYIDPDTGKKEKYFEMRRGPRDTHKFDAEGYKFHNEIGRASCRERVSSPV